MKAIGVEENRALIEQIASSVHLSAAATARNKSIAQLVLYPRNAPCVLLDAQYSKIAIDYMSFHSLIPSILPGILLMANASTLYYATGGRYLPVKDSGYPLTRENSTIVCSHINFASPPGQQINFTLDKSAILK